MATGSPERVPPVLRRAGPDDLAAVASLLDAYFREWDIWQRDTLEDLTAKVAMPTPGCFVAEEMAQLLGCVFGHPCPAMAAAAECKRLFVRPEARGRAIGRLLMAALEQAARDAGFDWLYLDTKDEFAAAIALYRKAGYTPCERYNDNQQATQFFRKRLR